MAYAYSKKESRFLKFSESLTDFLGQNSVDRGFIKLHQEDEKIIIDSDQNNDAIEIGRAPYCPFSSKNMLEYDWSDRPEKIPVACSCLIESPKSGQGILLTRRAGHLRTFPRLWVPPGGHIDEHESMEVAIKREVDEEIGLRSSGPNAVLDPSFKPIAAWESAFPGAAIPDNPPKRHHLVIYFLSRFMNQSFTADKKNIDPSSYDQMNEQIFKPPLINVNLDENEASACVWLSRDQARALVKDVEDCDRLLELCEPEDLRQLGMIIRQALKEKPESPVGNKLLNHPIFKECVQFPKPDLVQKLGPAWYFHTSTKKWILRPFDELFYGMLSGFRASSPSLSPERPVGNTEFIPSPPSRCSIGTLFAVECWLKNSVLSSTY